MEDLDVEVKCPKCNRINFLMIPRAKCDSKIYKKCQWCKQGMSVQVKVRKVNNIEDFLLKQKERPNISGPGYPEDSKTKQGEGGVNCDSAPTD